MTTRFISSYRNQVDVRADDRRCVQLGHRYDRETNTRTYYAASVADGAVADQYVADNAARFEAWLVDRERSGRMTATECANIRDGIETHLVIVDVDAWHLAVYESPINPDARAVTLAAIESNRDRVW
jgi:hypothetical protein